MATNAQEGLTRVDSERQRAAAATRAAALAAIGTSHVQRVLSHMDLREGTTCGPGAGNSAWLSWQRRQREAGSSEHTELRSRWRRRQWGAFCSSLPRPPSSSVDALTLHYGCKAARARIAANGQPHSWGGLPSPSP